ncbi:MAG: PD40 domain-containing protein [Myxococcales bacterium]|nr:PD40 domain-containing protein [Myxococcales bacterium]
MLALACGSGGEVEADESRASASEGLVYVKIVDGQPDLWRVRIADGQTRPLLSTPDRNESWPYWSRTSQRLVFQVEPEAGSSDLVSWSPELGEIPLTRTPGRVERWPVWSPDGQRLVYAFRGGRPAAGLGIVEMAQVERRILARTGPKDFYLRPDFSPDGDRLVSQRRTDEGIGSRLWLLERNEIPTPLLEESDAFDMKPHFDRSGTRVIFTRRPSRTGAGEIVVTGVDGQDLRILYEDPAADDHSARPSPTRDEIAFISDRGGRPQLYIGRLDGTELRQIVLEGRSAFAPRWSPDGDRLVVSTTTTPGSPPSRHDSTGLAQIELVVIDREGRRLVETPGLMPDWMHSWP